MLVRLAKICVLITSSLLASFFSQAAKSDEIISLKNLPRVIGKVIIDAPLPSSLGKAFLDYETDNWLLSATLSNEILIWNNDGTLYRASGKNISEVYQNRSKIIVGLCNDDNNNPIIVSEPPYPETDEATLTEQYEAIYVVERIDKNGLPRQIGLFTRNADELGYIRCTVKSNMLYIGTASGEYYGRIPDNSSVLVEMKSDGPLAEKPLYHYEENSVRLWLKDKSAALLAKPANTLDGMETRFFERDNFYRVEIHEMWYRNKNQMVAPVYLLQLDHTLKLVGGYKFLYDGMGEGKLISNFNDGSVVLCRIISNHLECKRFGN